MRQQDLHTPFAYGEVMTNKLVLRDTPLTAQRPKLLHISLVVALVAVLAGAVMPPGAQAGVLGSAVRGSLTKRATPMAFGQRAYGKPHDIVIDRAKYPQAAAHIDLATKNGQPSVLHIDRAGAKARRQENLASVDRTRKPAPNYQRDEFPPAFTLENSGGSSVKWISQHDNAGSGAALRWGADGLRDGTKIRILVK